MHLEIGLQLPVNTENMKKFRNNGDKNILNNILYQGIQVPLWSIAHNLSWWIMNVWAGGGCHAGILDQQVNTNAGFIGSEMLKSDTLLYAR